MSFGELPSFKFGSQPKTETVVNNVTPKEERPLTAQEVGQFDPKKAAFDIASLKRDMETMKRDVKDVKNMKTTGVTKDEKEFRMEMINFLRYLMDSIEKVTGGRFPTKDNIISKLKETYVK